MELKNLRTFQAVVDRGSYQRAAEALGYTQSTVTIHIQISDILIADSVGEIDQCASIL